MISKEKENLISFNYNQIEEIKTKILNTQNCKKNDLSNSIFPDILNLYENSNNIRSYFLLYFYNCVKLLTFSLDEINQQENLKKIL
ncbi:MAG: hypothetical protein P8Y97_04455, partial [Candidatus Lokiarchaeota archaeon]